MVLNSNEKIRLEEPRDLIESSSSGAHQYVRMLDFKTAQAEIEPPKISNVLTMSKSYPIFEQQGDVISAGFNAANQDVEGGDNPNKDNSIIASNNISDLREDMRSFTDILQEITAQYDGKYEELLRAYNEYWDLYVKKQDEEAERTRVRRGSGGIPDVSDSDSPDLECEEISEREKLDEDSEKIREEVSMSVDEIEWIRYRNEDGDGKGVAPLRSTPRGNAGSNAKGSGSWIASTSLSEPPQPRLHHEELNDNDVASSLSNINELPKAAGGKEDIIEETPKEVRYDYANARKEDIIEETPKEVRYDYANASEDDAEASDGDSSDSSTEASDGDSSDSSSDFMREKEADEDYDDYRERIFDFEPKKRSRKGKRRLVEEIDSDRSAPVNKENEKVYVRIEDQEGGELGEDRLKIESEKTRENGIKIEDELFKTVRYVIIDPDEIQANTAEDAPQITAISTDESDADHRGRNWEQRYRASRYKRNPPQDEDESNPGIVQLSNIFESNSRTTQPKLYVIINPDEIQANTAEDAPQIPVTSTDESDPVIREDHGEIQMKRPDNDFETLVQIYAQNLADSSSEDTDDEEQQYYEALDNAEEIGCDPIECTEEEEQEVVTKESIPARSSTREIFTNITQDLSDIKEVLNWNLKRKTENKIMLQPIRKMKPEDEDYFTLDGYEMELNSNEKIRLEEPRDLIESSSPGAHQYVRMLDFKTAQAEIEPPKISNVLTMSKRYALIYGHPPRDHGAIRREVRGIITGLQRILGPEYWDLYVKKQDEEAERKYDGKYEELLRAYNEYWDLYVKKQDEEAERTRVRRGSGGIPDVSDSDSPDLECEEISEREKLDEDSENKEAGESPMSLIAIRPI
ncbi:hypothetical protein QE152_g1444 [Popillia japonica]|uniref:Uncharacterized protein n=1 Tax=Popillia japonica TaxID=7064 RepID=A0AAW1N6B0_POPJA